MNFLQQQFIAIITAEFTQNHAALANASAKLDALSPLNTLKRGYAIASQNNHVLRHVKEVKIGDEINVKVMDGSMNCIVGKVFED